MEIKELAAQIQYFKTIRNQIEVGIDNLNKDDAASKKELDNKDRMGFEHVLDKAEIDMISSACGNMRYGLKQFNEGICELEMAYRRSVRLNRPVQEDKTKTEKKPE